MKNGLAVLLLLLFVIGCKQQPKMAIEEPIAEAETEEMPSFPKELESIFQAHGGLELWRKQQTLEFTIPKGENPETHVIDLWSRNEKISTPKYTMGFDGKTWLTDTEDTYKGNPEFYHNLMFYFYAMPFVLADDGINYDVTEQLQFDGKNYPGIQISYNDGVGTSPKDEYYLHYDPETYEMVWLGYTVTYRTGEDSDTIKWIRYNDWATFDGLVLPRSISWYNYEGREIKDLRNTVTFENVGLSEESNPASFYSKPENGKYWERPDSE